MQYQFNIKEGINLAPRNEAEEIMQNVSLIVTTIKGTVPLDREFGISADIVDAPMTRQSQLIGEIAAAIEKFEPRARLRKIEFTASADGKLEPHLTIEVN